jgi:hypothetical protein
MTLLLCSPTEYKAFLWSNERPIPYSGFEGVKRDTLGTCRRTPRGVVKMGIKFHVYFGFYFASGSLESEGEGAFS